MSTASPVDEGGHGPRLAVRPERLSVRSRRSLKSGLKAAYYGSALHRLTLSGPVPKALRLDPGDPIPGDAARGDALFQGRFSFAGHDIFAPNRPVWEPVRAPAQWLEEMHDFAWLRHFRANGGQMARRHARALVADWIAQYDSWHPLFWRSDLLARRLRAWLANAAFLFNGADASFRTRFLGALARQARHLFRAGVDDVAGARRIAALHGMLACALCLPGSERRIAGVLRRLDAEIASQILADGGHISRCPRIQAQALNDLVGIRSLLLGANRVPGASLLDAIDRMAPMLRMLRHGDGRLALFNGADEGTAAEIDQCLAAAEARGKALAGAPYSGFQRLAAGRTTVILDVGSPSPFPEHRHDGALSFEMSAGRQRLVVNCGALPDGDAEWRRALARRAAHSSLAVDDAWPPHGRHRRTTPEVASTRNEDSGDIWIDASVESPAFGPGHRRRLYLAAGGDDFRGEDSLLGGTPARVTVRFHLHPDVQVSQARDGTTILLRPPGDMGWRFRVAGGSVELAESVYFGTAGERRRSEQIVVRGETGGDRPPIKWAFRKFPGR